MTMGTPTDEQVKSYIESVPGLREEWGISGALRLAKVTFIVMNVLLIAVIIGVIAYFAFTSPELSTKGVSGLIIILVLAYAASVVRIFQLRAERKELPRFRQALARRLTGNPETDTEAQQQVEGEFKWESMRYRIIVRMIGIAGLVILTINTYQVGTVDFARVLLFDGAILIYLAGAFWNNYAFKADLLEVELQERSRATIRWQTEHPGEAQREEAQRDAGHVASHESHEENQRPKD